MSKILAQGMITLTQLYEGAQVILTPAAVLIPCDSKETPKSNAYTNAFTNVKAFLGTMDITSKITLGTLECSDSTVKANKTGTKVSITTITTRTGYVDIPVSVAIDGETIDLGKHRFSFVKQIDGQTGQPGVPGDPGFSYTLNIKGGTRGVAYAANGTNPEPKTSSQFSVDLLKNGVKVSNPASISWTCGGNLSGSSSIATFTPTIKSTYNSGSSYVKVSIKEFANSLAVEETIPIICTKHADGLDWINEWNEKYVQIGTEKIITPKIFAGEKNSANELTGVAIGRDVLGGNTNKVIGIVGYKKNTPVFSLDQEANFFVSSSGSAGDIKNGTNNAKGLYFDGNNLYVSGKVKISGGSTIGESNTSVEEVINNSNLGAQANNKIDNLSIGGKNLLLTSNMEHSPKLVKSSSISSGLSTELYPSNNSFKLTSIKTDVENYYRFMTPSYSNLYGLEAGEYYTLSGYVRGKVTGSFVYRSESSDGSSSWVLNNHRENLNVESETTFKFFKFSTKIPVKAKGHYVSFQLFSPVIGDWIELKDVKFEKGNKATDWTPAPEDVDSEINKKANTTDVYKKTETYTKTETDSAINVSKEAIELGISNTYETKNNVETKISSANTSTLNSAKSYADTKKNEAINTAGADATSKVNSAKSELNTVINNINIGGRNYIKNALFNGSSNWRSLVIDSTKKHNGHNVARISASGNTANRWTGFNQHNVIVSPKAGDEYTVSFWYLVEDKSALDNGFAVELKAVNTSGSQATAGSYPTINASSVTNGVWTKFSYTMKITKTDLASLFIFPWVCRNGEVWFSEIKVEKGNKVTDFSVAPEDLDTAINKKANSSDVYNKSETYTKTETDSKITIAKNEINLGVSDTYETKANVETKINNIQVGGVNRLTGTATSKNTNVNVPTSYVTLDPYTTPNKQTLEALGFKVGDKVTVSFDWSISQNGSNAYTYGNFRLEFKGINSNGVDNQFIGVLKNPVATFSSSNTKGTEAITTTLNSSTIKTHTLRFRIDNSVLNFKVSNVKLEKGNKPTTWSPAPEDVDTAINKKANSTDVYTKSEVYTKAETASQINIAKDAINLGVSQTYETKTDTTTKINNAVNGIKIGGTNLILGTNIPVVNSNWSSSGWSGSFKATDEKRVYKLQAVNGWRVARYNLGKENVGKQFTISFSAKLLSSETTSTGSNGLYLANATSGTFASKDITSALPEKDSWARYTETFTLNSTGFAGIGCKCTPENSNIKTTWLIKELKIESGNKATDWTPAPQDVDSDILSVSNKIESTNTKVATIETNLNSITSRVSSTENTVSTHTTQLNTVDSRIDTAKNSAISTASNDATSKANTAQNNAINSAKTYTDGQITTVNRTITDKVAEIKTTTDSITSRVSKAENTLTATTNELNNLQIGGVNLFKNSNLYKENSKLSVPANKDNYFVVTELSASLVKGEKYTFQIKTDGTWGNTTGTDTVEAFLLKDQAYTTYFRLDDKVFTFTCPETGIYYLRLDVNKLGTKHSFWDMKVEKGTKATDFSVSLIDIESKIESAEQEITSTAIVNKVSEGISNGGSINTVSTILDKNGFTVKNGGIKVKNRSDADVMWVDVDGNLSTNKLRVYGDGNNTVSFEGNGAKHINLKSDNGDSTFINFISKDNTKSRIGVYNSSNRSGQLFIEPGSADKNVKAVLIVRGANSDLSGNEAVQMELYGNMVVSKTIAVHEYISLPGARRAVGSTNVRHLRTVSRGSGEYYLEIAGDDTYPSLGITTWVSDAYCKENIDYTKETALDKIMQIEHASFNYLNGSERKLGVVAQQLELVEPSWVLHVPQEDGGEIIQPVVHEIIPYLTKAIQEQQQQINNLNSTIETLVKRIEALESKNN